MHMNVYIGGLTAVGIFFFIGTHIGFSPPDT